jgi:hypothetical protein
MNVGSGPALIVGQTGTGDIASFYDTDQNLEILHVGGENSTYPNVGVKTSSPNRDFTVRGEISASKVIWDATGNSTQWNSVYSNVGSLSANWQSTYSTVSSLSSTWNYQGTDLKTLSANWQSTYSTVSSLSSTWNYQGTDLKTLTGDWVGGNNAYTNLVSNSAAYLSSVDLSFLSVSANWQNTYSTVQNNSATTWNYQGTDLKDLSANWQQAYTFVGANSADLTITNSISAKYYYGTLLDWMTLIRGYNAVPTLLQTTGSGKIYTYTYATTGTDKTYYRYIATDRSEDSFYGTYTGGVLSNLVAKKTIIL